MPKQVLSRFSVDFWTGWGLAALVLFGGSFLVRWLKGKRAKKSWLPTEFWYLHLVGGLMLLVYVLVRRDLVFAVVLVLQTLIYLQSICFGKRNGRRREESLEQAARET